MTEHIWNRFEAVFRPNLIRAWNMHQDLAEWSDPGPGGRRDVEAYYDPDPDVPGKMSAHHGGFLEHIDRSKPQFLGIDPARPPTPD